MQLSIIISNYNYDRYVGAAIESALGVDWPDKEIIVADDGSTDNSRKVITAYGSKVIPLFLSNGGQNSACNAAFDRSRGDIIIFLDADDVLFPSVADTLHSAWSDRVSKLQWSLAITDKNLTLLGFSYPTYRIRPTPEWVRQSLMRTGHYPFSPTSGGAWARTFLSQVFPLPVREGDARGPRSGCNGDYRVPSADQYLGKLAPFFGDVVCISPREPQGAYRVHTSNSHYGAVTLEDYPNICLEQLQCTCLVNSLLTSLKISSERINAENDENFMKRLFICQRLGLGSPQGNSSSCEALWKYWRSVALDYAPIATKMKWYIWSLLVAGPPPVSLWAIRMRERWRYRTTAPT
jgi:hypothetical protein